MGAWTFRRLGLPTVVVEPGTMARRLVDVRRAFRLPPAAHQGRGSWFRLLIHYELAVAPDSGSGTAVLSVNTNGPAGTFLQIAFDASRLESGHLKVTSDSLGLASGHVVRDGERLVWRGRFENFAPYPGIRPGGNSLGVQVEQEGHVRITEARVFQAGSAILWSNRAPKRKSVHS